MKLHLPKLLLTAVLAAVCYTPAWATSDSTTNSGWGVIKDNNGVSAPDSYGIGDATITSIDTADSTQTTGGLFIRSNNSVNTATVGTLNVNRNLTIDGWWQADTNHPEFTDLTVSALTLNNGATLTIAESNSVTVKEFTVNGGTNTLTGNTTIGYTKTKDDGTKENIGLMVKSGGNLSITGGTHNIVKIDVHCQGTSTTETLTIAGATVNVTGGDYDISGDSSGTAAVVLGHWHYGTGKMVIGNDSGTASLLNVTGGTIRMSWDSSSNLEIKSGGTVNAKGIQFANTTDDDAVITVSGGSLNLGEGGISANSNRSQGAGKRELNLNSGTLGVLAENVSIAAGTTTIGGEFTIDTAIVDAAGNATGETATITFASGVTMTDTADLTIKGGGSVDFGSSPFAVTTTISVLDSTELKLTGGVTVDRVNHKLDLISKTADAYFSSDGETEATNGFMVENATYRLFDGYVWNGTVTGFTVGENDGDTTLTASGAGTVFYVNEGTHDISTAGDYINGRATGYIVESGATLIIDANQSDTMTASKILAETTGEGNITVSTNATIGNNVATLATGTLTVNNGVTLKVGEGKDHTSSIASFGAVKLDGGTLQMHNNGSTVNNLTVASESTLHVEDSALAATVTRLAGTTLLNAELNVTSSWKGTLQIDKLTGVGNLDIDAANNWGDANDSLAVNINALDNYSGVISYKSAVNLWGTPCTNNIISIKNLNGDEYKAINMGGLYLEAGVSGDMVAPVTANVDIGNNASYGASSLGAVTMSGGSVLSMFNRGGGSLVNMTSLTVTDTATIGTTRNSSCFQSTVNIGTLANGVTDAEATLNLINGSMTAAVTAYNLNGGNGFNGTINVKGDSDSGKDRRVALNINSANAAKGAVINFLDASTIDKNGATAPDAADITANMIALGLGANATVAGLGAEVVEGQETALTTNAVEIMGYKIKGGVENFTTRADDDTATSARTLSIDTAEGKTYEVNANVNADINLVKSGSGTQNFSGDMSAFNGTVEVSGGTLGFTKADGAVTVSSLTLTGGTLNVTGTLTLTNVTVDLSQYTAGTDFELVKAGGYGEGSNFDWTLSNTDAVGNYTVALEKKDNSVWLTWDEVTSITTTVDGFSFNEDKTMLTLTVDLKDGEVLSDNMSVIIEGFGENVLAGILGEVGANAMVGITIKDTLDGDVGIVGNSSGNVAFAGPFEEPYTGELVDSNWQYNVSYIPEPTTATLSLLALMGLAARRRRASR